MSNFTQSSKSNQSGDKEMTDYDERADNVRREYYQEEAVEEAFNKGLKKATEIMVKKIMNIDNTYLSPQNREKLAKALEAEIKK